MEPETVTVENFCDALEYCIKEKMRSQVERVNSGEPPRLSDVFIFTGPEGPEAKAAVEAIIASMGQWWSCTMP